MFVHCANKLVCIWGRRRNIPANNNVFQKNANTSLIARTIWKKGSISRAAIAKELGLYRSTVTNIITSLIDGGVIVQGNLLQSTQQGGRKAVELSINGDFGCVMGFDIQPSHYRSVILSVNGKELWRETGSFGFVPMEQMIDGVLERAFKAHENIGTPVLALAFAVPGIVDNSYSSIKQSFPFGIENLNIREYVQKKYDYPVFVENDANAAAWLDIMKNPGGDAISVVADFHEEASMNPNVVGIGAGVGVIINGSVYRGAHNAAGEFKSYTWKKGLNIQSGIDFDTLRRTEQDRSSLALWIEDTFRSFIPLFSVMDFEEVIFHGQPFADSEWVLKTIESSVPEFAALVHQTGTTVLFDAQDECVSARGAAVMYLQNLFSVPNLEDSESSFRFAWDEVIQFSKKQRRR